MGENMKCLLIAAVVVATVSALPRSILKTWESHGELTDNLQAPAVTNELIAAVNNDESSGWKAGENARFTNTTLEQAKVLMGTLQNDDKSTWLPYKAVKPIDIPTEFDWRTDTRAKSCSSVSEIRDQSNCGSCWAFGSVEAMSDRSCIKGKYAHFSAQDVTSCDHLGDMGCSGGVPSTVYTYQKTFGIVDGGNYGDKSGCWSYQLAPCAPHINGSKYPACPDSTNAASCARKCENGKTWAASKVRGAGGYSVCQQGMLAGACAEAMAQDIYQNGPITGMFFVKQDFLTYKSGVYTPSLFSPMLGGHAIKIMGFGTEGGKDYWLVANSWNEAWGDKGYFKIRRGTNAAMIESAIINGGPAAGNWK